MPRKAAKGGKLQRSAVDFGEKQKMEQRRGLLYAPNLFLKECL